MFYRNKAGKLVDCLGQWPQVPTELFIVEGDSAAASVARLRNTQLQAVFPLQGKPLNAAKASLEKIQENVFFQSLATAMTDTRTNQLRFEKLLILMDPDADGIHCAALLMLYLERMWPSLIDTGRVHLVQAPMAQVTNLETGELHFAYAEKQFLALLQSKEDKTKLQVTRYRGLGNIPPAVLATHCIDPNSRRSMKLSAKDVQDVREVFGG